MKWFTADNHHEHSKILSITDRGKSFSSIEEHDEIIINNINEKVGKGDQLFLLGDFAWKNPGKFRHKINCKHCFFVLGNHDRRYKTKNVFGEIPWMRTVKLFNKEIAILSHFVQIFWDKCHRGSYHLSGHTHSRKEDMLDKLFPERRSMDVGLDNYYRLFGKYYPFSEKEIVEILSHRKGHDPIENYKNEKNKT